MGSHDNIAEGSSHAETLREVTHRYERLVQALSILRQMDEIDDPTEDISVISLKMLETIALGLSAENCSLMLWNEEEQCLDLRAACSPYEEHGRTFEPGHWDGCRFKLGQGIVGTVAESGEPARVNDVAVCSRFISMPNSNVMVSSLLCYPLVYSGKTIGVINLSHSKPAFFTKDSEQIMAVVAGRIAGFFRAHLLWERLLQGESHHRQVLENATDGILVYDLQGRVISANGAIGKISGYSPDKLISGEQKWESGIDEQDRRRFLEFKNLTLSGQGPTEILYQYIDNQGQVHHLDQRSSLLRGPDGQASGVVCVIRDVTRNDESEKELKRYRQYLDRLRQERSVELIKMNENLAREINDRKKAEQAYRLLVEHSLQGLILIQEGRVILANRHAEEILGLPQGCSGYLSEDDFFGRIHPEDRPRVQDLFQKCLRGEARIIQDEYRVVKDESGIRWHEMYGTCIDYGGTPAIQMSLLDVSERRETQDALRESEARFRLLVQSSGDVFIVLDGNGIERYVSSSMERLTGYHPADLIGKDCFEFIHPEDQPKVKQVFQFLLDQPGKSARVEFRRKHVKGHWVNLEAIGTNFLDDPILQGVVVNVRDITERIEAEKERRELKEQLLQSQKMDSIGHLAGGVAHDFNNHLAAIMGYSDLMLRRLSKDDSLYRMAQEISKAGDSARGLTQQLLAFSRKQVLEIKVLNLNITIQGMVNMLKRLIGEDIDLVLETDENLGNIRADDSQMQQILLNLAVNARDSMPTGGRVVISTSQEKSQPGAVKQADGPKPGDYVVLTVSDTGCGIPRDALSKIFDPFFTTKERGKGTGLGLSMVHGIVKQHGGEVLVFSRVGQGTTFKMFFPLVEEEVSPQRDHATVAQAKKGTETVLVVEDENNVRELVQQMLGAFGYKVLEASGLREALEVASQCEDGIDLLLTDVVMPEADGRQVYEQLVRRMPGMKVLYMSGYTDEVIAPHGVLQEGVSFLQKPFTVKTLTEKVREILDGGISGREGR